MYVPLFSQFIEAKPLYYEEIDHLRVHKAYALLEAEIGHPESIHIVGTNGKGSTGRMIAYLAYRSGLKTGHFSSPHILKFNERIWINGSDSSDALLERAHRRLYGILGSKRSEALSYFEYTTLLALVAFENLDLIVLEAGLGGEYDASNVCKKALSVITPIGIDHQSFLGKNIEEIASTKIRSIEKQALLAPQPYPEVFKIAKKIADKRGAYLYICSSSGRQSVTDTQLSGMDSHATVLSCLPGDTARSIADKKGWPDYLLENALVAMKALEILDISYCIDDLYSLELFGRFYPLAYNIRIDVGHNPLAAKAIVSALEERVVLIYHSLDDKDYAEVLRILEPKIKRVEIIPIQSPRAVAVEKIEAVLQNLGLDYSHFNGAVDPDENYLVFGSFYTVEAFLESKPELLD